MAPSAFPSETPSQIPSSLYSDESGGIRSDWWEIVQVDGEVGEVCYPSKKPMLIQDAGISAEIMTDGYLPIFHAQNALLNFWS